MGRLHLYRNISITFIVFAAMILCAVFLLFYSQATIIVTPDAQTVNLSFNALIKTSSTPQDLAKDGSIGGAVTVITQQVESIFNASSTRPASASNIVGQVRLVNNYSKAQKLVKTTQLQAENGVIVRTDSDVDIPAGGSVIVAVFPKDEASFKKIDSGKLVIIKLWPQLQPMIYGEVIEPLDIRASGDVRYISESDINFAKKALIDKAVSEAASSTSNAAVLGDLASYSIDKKLGDEAKVFTMKAAVRIRVISADPAQLAALIQSKALKTDLNGLSADGLDMSAVKLSVTDASNPASIAVKISYPLRAYLTQSSDLLAKKNFAGKTAQEIRNYAAKIGIIKNIEVIISPYWRDKTPTNESSIKVIVK